MSDVYLYTTIFFVILSAILAWVIFGLQNKLRQQPTAQELEEKMDQKIQTQVAAKVNAKLETELQAQKEQLNGQWSQELKSRIDSVRTEKQQQLEEIKTELKEKFAEKEANIREELETKSQIILEKQKLQLLQEIQGEEKQMRQRVLELQENVDRKESQLTERMEKMDKDRQEIEEFRKQLEVQNADLVERGKIITQKEQTLEQELQKKLTEIAALTLEEARQRVLDLAKKEMGEELLSWQQKYLDNYQETADLKAREIVSLAIQRCSSEVANELTITTIKIQNDEDKGKLIGKGGRNIQWLEKTLGVELVIDETPGVVTISGFSSIRRHIAKRTLEKLLVDGRVHPAAIEEMYDKAKGEISQEIADAGQWAVNELGIYDFPAKLIRILGRLKFRTSYGQNQLKHSVEMAKLAGLLAKDLNAQFPSKTPIDIDICVKGALLHDIGKGVDEEGPTKGNHIELGEKICDIFNLDWKIKKCISSHHTTGGDLQSYNDTEHGYCIEAAIVDACDNISGGRPGARKETMEAYFQRMESLERVANSTPGVAKSWIMRGARELWVFFDTNALSPDQAHQATRQIARHINDSVRTPQEIKVIGFREDRVVEYSR